MGLAGTVESNGTQVFDHISVSRVVHLIIFSIFSELMPMISACFE